MALLVIGVMFNSIMALVIGSVFHNLPNETGSLYSRGALLFFAILLHLRFVRMLESMMYINNFIRKTSNCREAVKICLLPFI